MSFDSILFLSFFFPLLMIGSFIRKERFQNSCLIIIGLLFYSFGSLSGLLLLLLSVAVNFAIGVVIMKSSAKKAALVCGILLNVAFIVLFKVEVFSRHIRLAAPLGISFFTFKNISYLIDTKRDNTKGTPHFFDYLLYVSFFPQILSGPITRFADFSRDLEKREMSPQKRAEGVKRLIYGLSKKLIIAGAAERIVREVFALSAGALDIRLAWLGAVAYTLQLFFDFSGYSDMAIGLGELFGFHTPENFDYPYIANSITDFWRRWHISLSLWFRDYVYIPLGGNRRGKNRAAFNKFVVFTLCGLWHGVSWTYVLWGVWHGLLSAAETVYPSLKVKKNGFKGLLSHILTLLFVCIGFVMFRAESVSSGLSIIAAMFTGFRLSASGTVLLHTLLNARAVTILLIGCLLSAPTAKALAAKLVDRAYAKYVPYILCVLLAGVCLSEIASGGFEPFIYFQF